LVLELKDVGTESGRVLVVPPTELEERPEVYKVEEEVRVVVGVKTGGHGGKVMAGDDDDKEERADVSVEREVDPELGLLYEGVKKLKLKLEGNSKVIDDGTSGTEV
jgi:hypothetical protein